MPIQIGAKSEGSFTNPIGLLTDCHRRIKKFLVMMITLIRQTHGGSLTKGQQDALKTALQYFREAAPKHTMDEEVSLFPRMRAFTKENVLIYLSHLEEEHKIADENHRTLELIAEKWFQQGQLSSEDVSLFSDALGRLSVIYKKHIEIEDHQIFPLASKVLSSADLIAIGREMAIRRNINLDQLV